MESIIYSITLKYSPHSHIHDFLQGLSTATNQTHLNESRPINNNQFEAN